VAEKLRACREQLTMVGRESEEKDRQIAELRDRLEALEREKGAVEDELRLKVSSAVHHMADSHPSLSLAAVSVS
jgi:septal ring factor EnvC (AmiA/AmiB activator)